MITERGSYFINSVERNLRVLDGNLFGCDIDSVIQATVYAALNYASYKFEKIISVEELSGYWELAKIAMAQGETQDTAIDFAKAAFNRAEVYRNSPPVPGAPSLLKILRTIGTPHVFISSRPSEFLDVTREWFLEKFPWVDPEDIVINRPEGMNGGVFKSQEVKKRSVLLFIEDALEEAEIIAEETEACVLMPARPWNIYQEIKHPRIWRVGTEDELMSLWPVVRFLASRQARGFLDVAQY